ncbi:MAG TPA: prepilin peptidase, partial [Patescibacteria group bacterium]|nr:prepilin peptidase [Patescibacteria group bacterium]
MPFLITNYELLITFVLGTAIGSFLNVWSRRLLRGESPTGRSHCEHCGHVLSASDLVPLLSFILLRGRCRYCHKPLSWQYP